MAEKTPDPGAVTLAPHEFEELTAAIRRRRSTERKKLPVLRVTSGSDMLAFCAIYPRERILIGRDEACELQVTDVSVSREHAAVTYHGPDSLTLEDLGSTNGTRYQGEQVHGEVTIQVGGEVTVGSVTIRIELLTLEESRTSPEWPSVCRRPERTS